MTFTITETASYSPAEICAVWNASFGPEFHLTERLWLQNTQSDPSFLASDLLVATDTSGGLAGFVLTKRFRDGTRFASPALEKYAPYGYIAALAVLPAYQKQGLGRQLLKAAETKLAQAGVTQVAIGESFRHFLPGLPQGYEAAQHLFEAAEYTIDKQHLSYDLTGQVQPRVFEAALASVTDLVYQQGQPGSEKAILDFLTRVFPGRWHYEVALFLEQGGAIEDITLAVDKKGLVQGFLMTYWAGSRILGPTIYWQPEQPAQGGIGPLGVSVNVRGSGAGLGLVAAGLRHLHSKGVEQVRIDWTGLVGFYGRLGFEPMQAYLRCYKDF
jgi:predicted N-acetyltransferase YhbS